MRHAQVSRFAGLIVALLAPASTALGRPAADAPAALIDLPYIRVDTANGVDTLVQVANSNRSAPVTVKCFWESANAHCSNSPTQICTASAQCPPSGACAPDWATVDFIFTLTPNQSVAFLASHGLPSLPCSSMPPPMPCTGTASGVVIPVPEDPYVGRMQCLTIDDTLSPTEENVLRGQATIEHYEPGVVLDAARYNAVGFAAYPGRNNGDDVLVLGTQADATSEYEACPAVEEVSHFFENAIEPVSGTAHVFTRLIVAPCSHDPYVAAPGHATVDYLVYNEFEQRLSLRRPFAGLQFDRLSSIHPLAWDVGLQGTLTGKTRMINIVDNNAFVVVAIEEQEDAATPPHVSSAALNAYHFADRTTQDTIGATATCGNGSVEPGEQCDDGNLIAGDGCDGSCATETCYVCHGSPSLCGPPTTCAAPTESSLLINDNRNDARDKLQWTWQGISFGAIDNPQVATDYTLCVYDSGQVAMHGSIAHAGTCGSGPCWRALGTNGFRYRNPGANADGFITARLKRLSADEVQIAMNGKGLHLGLPAPASATQFFTQSPKVTVALYKSATGECWQSDFVTNTTNTTAQFRAVIP